MPVEARDEKSHVPKRLVMHCSKGSDPHSRSPQAVQAIAAANIPTESLSRQQTQLICTSSSELLAHRPGDTALQCCNMHVEMQSRVDPRLTAASRTSEGINSPQGVRDLLDRI